MLFATWVCDLKCKLPNKKFFKKFPRNFYWFPFPSIIIIIIIIISLLALWMCPPQGSCSSRLPFMRPAMPLKTFSYICVRYMSLALWSKPWPWINCICLINVDLPLSPAPSRTIFWVARNRRFRAARSRSIFRLRSIWWRSSSDKQHMQFPFISSKLQALERYWTLKVLFRISSWSLFLLISY